MAFARARLLALCALGLCPANSSAQDADGDSPRLEAVIRGDALFAQGRFAEATEAYEEAVANRPQTAEALADLARMRLYQHREDDASALAQRAIALAPGNSLASQVLHSVELRRQAFAAGIFQMDHSGPGSADFVVTEPLPVVRVRVAGHDAKFFIDTGAPNIAVNRSLATSLALTLETSGVGVFAGGKQASVEKTMVPALELGGLHIANVPAAVNPVELQLPGLRTEGAIGTGLLMHFLATMDYCRGRLILAPRSSSSVFERRAARSGANVVPMWLVGDHFIFARGKLNAVEGLFSIDTGLAGAGLMATKATIMAAGVKLDESHAQLGQGGGGAVRGIPFQATATLGASTLNQVPGVFMPAGDPYRIFPFKVAGALSHGFFRHSRLTFDFDAMKLITEKC